jgi:uncharacterized membrane protein
MWLLGIGVLAALAAAVFGFVDFFSEQLIRNLSAAWQHMIGNLLAVVLASVNWYLRYSAGAEAGARGWGLWLSLVTVLLLLFNGWRGWDLVYRHHVGVGEKAVRR